MKRLVCAAVALAAALAVLPASAQYPGGGYGGRGSGSRTYDEDEDDYPRRRRPPAYDSPYGQQGPGQSGSLYGRQGYGPPAQRLSICITARGNCPWRPAPPNSPCGCDIPGFGFKRGAVVGR